jgi:hypothetical protein
MPGIHPGVEGQDANVGILNGHVFRQRARFKRSTLSARRTCVLMDDDKKVRESTFSRRSA